MKIREYQHKKRPADGEVAMLWDWWEAHMETAPAVIIERENVPEGDIHTPPYTIVSSGKQFLIWDVALAMKYTPDDAEFHDGAYWLA